VKKSIGADTLAYPSPVWCVGSYDAQGRPNVMTIAWGGICCSKPPAVTVSLRRATYTYGCIQEHGAYTVSIPSLQYASQADYFGIVSGRNTDKFKDTGLTAVPSERVDAPYVGEFPLILECKVMHTHEIGLHTQFIGEIVNVLADDDILNAKGLPLMDKAAPFVYGTGTREYWALGETIGRGFDIGNKYRQ